MVTTSIVIPTFWRPKLLSRAIKSVLEVCGESVEIIVVPNGGDESWKGTLQQWSCDQRVIVSPIEPASVSAARNHGMELASGTYLRFLDDDDYLLSAAAQQVDLLERTGADLCYGSSQNVDEHGTNYGVNASPDSADFVVAALTLSSLSLPVGNLWRRSAVAVQPWDLAMREAEDYAWIMDLAARGELTWVRVDDPVGVWFQHRGPRGSSVARQSGRQDAVLAHIRSLHARLHATGRANAARCAAVARALWYYAHRGFPYHPIHWSRVAREALRIDAGSKPAVRAYQEGPLRDINPLLAEWALLPGRCAMRSVREMAYLWRDRDYRRRL